MGEMLCKVACQNLCAALIEGMYAIGGTGIVRHFGKLDVSQRELQLEPTTRPQGRVPGSTVLRFASLTLFGGQRKVQNL